mgnify:CR=1 FL=1
MNLQLLIALSLAVALLTLGQYLSQRAERRHGLALGKLQSRTLQRCLELLQDPAPRLIYTRVRLFSSGTPHSRPKPILQPFSAPLLERFNFITNPGTAFNRAAYAAAGALPAELPQELSNVSKFTSPAMSFPNGCHVAEVEIDPETGVVRIDRFAACDDFGNVINPMIVEGQVHGGLAQGIGQALLEHGVYDTETGQLLTGSYMDYAMPRADDLPSFQVDHTCTPCTHNPLGVTFAAVGPMVAMANVQGGPEGARAIFGAIIGAGIMGADMELFTALAGPAS